MESRTKCRHITVPFLAKFPSFLYEEQIREASPNARPHRHIFLRFVEARAVLVRKEMSLQLRTDDFRHVARGSDHFAGRVHNSLFMFVMSIKQGSSGNGSPQCNGSADGVGGVSLSRGCAAAADDGRLPKRARRMVRGFRLDRLFRLVEEHNQSIVSSAWNDFMCSDLLDCTINIPECNTNDEYKGRSAEQMRIVEHTAATVCVPSWCTLAQYSSREPTERDWQYHPSLKDASSSSSSGEGSYYTLPWGCTHGGRISLSYACNVYAGSVCVPLLMPASELHPAGIHPLRSAVASMPIGWYADCLADARVNCIEYHKHKSILCVQLLDERIFRYKECLPMMPIGRAERKGKSAYHEIKPEPIDPMDALQETGQAKVDEHMVHDELAEEVHDDIAPTPAMEIAQEARWRHHLQALPLGFDPSPP